MPLHPLAEQFATVAGAYERGRPEYAPAVVASFSAELGLPPGGRVLDLAAGTGKLSRALLAAGLDLVAVEPLPSLREVLAEHVGADRVLDGVAERIPLPDASVDAVTIADAFHWFDQAAALAEVARVLRPGGGLAVLGMLPDWSAATWAQELATLLLERRPEHPHFDGPPWREAVRAAGGWSAVREIRVTTTQPLRREKIVDLVASMSWIAAMPESQRAATLEQVRACIDAGQTPAEMPTHVVLGLVRRLTPA